MCVEGELGIPRVPDLAAVSVWKSICVLWDVLFLCLLTSTHKFRDVSMTAINIFYSVSPGVAFSMTSEICFHLT